MSSITIGDRVITAGIIVEATSRAEKVGLCPAGLKPIIHNIRQQHGEWQIALHSRETKVDGWHDLEGALPDSTAYWITQQELIDCFAFSVSEAEVKDNIMLKNRNLKGMTGKILSLMDKQFYFLEFDEDVGGCSADGLGKAGHCVAINKKHLKLSKNQFKLIKEK
jgi:hypothetical protein